MLYPSSSSCHIIHDLTGAEEYAVVTESLFFNKKSDGYRLRTGGHVGKIDHLKAQENLVKSQY